MQEGILKNINLNIILNLFHPLTKKHTKIIFLADFSFPCYNLFRIGLMLNTGL